MVPALDPSAGRGDTRRRIAWWGRSYLPRRCPNLSVFVRQLSSFHLAHPGLSAVAAQNVIPLPEKKAVYRYVQRPPRLPVSAAPTAGAERLVRHTAQYRIAELIKADSHTAGISIIFFIHILFFK